MQIYCWIPLTSLDFDAGWMHARLRYNGAVCRCQLCRPKLLFEEHTYRRSSQVRTNPAYGIQKSFHNTDFTTSANVVGASVASRGPTTPVTPVEPEACPATFACPQDDGCTFQDGSRIFALSCGVDYYGGDFTSMYTESLRACTQACAENTLCVAASYTGGRGAGYCYLKDKKNGSNTNDNVDGKCQ